MGDMINPKSIQLIRINIIMLTNDTPFRPCSVSLYLSFPRKLIGPLDPSSPVRLMAATLSLPDRG